MKTNLLRKNFLSYILIIAFFMASPFFLLFPRQVANATEGVLSIAGQEQISIDTSNFQLTATLRGSQVYTARNIVWKFELNGNVSTAITSNIGAEVNNSIATFAKALYPQQAGEVGTATAYIESNGKDIYKATWQVLFVKNESSNISIVPNTLTQEYNANGEYEYFQLSLNAKDVPQGETIDWLLLSSNGKYVNIAGENSTTLNYKPTAPGEYTFKAKIGNVFTRTLQLTVKYATLGRRLVVKEPLIEKNRNGLDTYFFELENIDEDAHDVENINWYKKGHSTPLQYGGKSFLFQPTAYATYQIYAKYDNNISSTPPSNEFLVEIKIDRTQDILWFSLALFGVLAVGLVFLIRKNIKNDKVW
jgi:hypothetical protein